MKNTNKQTVDNTQMQTIKTTFETPSRRGLLKSAIGVGALGAVLSTTLQSTWTRPVINAVVLPAHAQTSACPDAIIGNVTFGPQSGSSMPAVCRLTFDVLSSDTATPLNVISITNGSLGSNVTITYDSFGVATGTTGPRVVWAGPDADAPFCRIAQSVPIDDVTFTVTADCAILGTPQIVQNFTLLQILADNQ